MPDAMALGGDIGTDTPRHVRRRRPAHPFARMVASRVAWLVVTLFVISMLVFAATQALPGDPAQAILGRSATPDRLAALREELGLNRPVLDQYSSWLGNVLTGDFGASLASGTSVATLVGVKVQNSLWLVLFASLASVPAAVGLALLTASRPGTLLDRMVNTAMLTIVALPEFVVAIGLVVLLSTTVWHLFPAVSVVYGNDSVLSEPKVLVLPALTLAIMVLPYMMRLAYASAVEVLDSEYVRAARLRGTTGSRLLLRHVLPNVAPPVLQATVLVLVYLLGGVVIVEAVFNYPGIGRALVEAVRLRDVPVIQVLALGIAGFYLVLGALADVLTLVLTPRLRSGRR